MISHSQTSKLQSSSTAVPLDHCCLPVDTSLVSSLDSSSLLLDPVFSLGGQLGSKLLKTLVVLEGRMSVIVCSARVDHFNALAFL